MRIKSWHLALLYSGLLWLIAYSLTSCNPVKRVMRDPEKVHRVFTQALRSGIESCVTDTVTVHKSDTLVTTDTSWVFDTQVYTDTVKLPSQILTKFVTKTIRITDTVKLKIKDVTTEQILRGDVLALREKLSAETLAKNEAKKDANWWKLICILSWVLFGVYIFRKPILTLITKIRL